MPRPPNKHCDLVHMVACTLVNDFVMLVCELLGIDNAAKTETLVGHLMPKMPGNGAMKKIWSREVEGDEAIAVICKEILEMYNVLELVATANRHDWVRARRGRAIRWNGNLYSSGYGALEEFFSSVARTIQLTWKDATEPDYQAMYDGLIAAEGKADLLDLLVYAEQEYAVLHAQQRYIDESGTKATDAATKGQTPSKPEEDRSAFRNASEFVDGLRFKDLMALKRFLEAHPDIRTDKPHDNRLVVHAGDLMRAKKEEVELAMKAEKTMARKTQAYLAGVRQPNVQEKAK